MGNKKIASFSEDDFHHLGYACFDIKTEVKNFSFLGYKMEGNIFCDETQGVAGCFLEGPGPRIELLENLPGSETLSPWIEIGHQSTTWHTMWMIFMMLYHGLKKIGLCY